ncbi:hypothetical protein Tco_0943482 [Tanacetum coccineum]
MLFFSLCAFSCDVCLVVCVFPCFVASVLFASLPARFLPCCAFRALCILLLFLGGFCALVVSDRIVVVCRVVLVFWFSLSTLLFGPLLPSFSLSFFVLLLFLALFCLVRRSTRKAVLPYRAGSAPEETESDQCGTQNENVTWLRDLYKVCRSDVPPDRHTCLGRGISGVKEDGGTLSKRAGNIVDVYRGKGIFG